MPGSPAIDAGDTTKAPPTDQRGFARVGTPDIGAYEFGGKSQGVVYDAANDFSVASNPNGVWSYGYQASLGSNFQLYDAVVTDPNGATGIVQWYSPPLSGNYTPTVGYNTTSSFVNLPVLVCTSRVIVCSSIPVQLLPETFYRHPLDR